MKSFQWLVASILVLTVGLSMAELGSSAPTSGGVSTLCKGRNYILTFLVALLLDVRSFFPSLAEFTLLDRWLYVFRS